MIERLDLVPLPFRAPSLHHASAWSRPMLPRDFLRNEVVQLLAKEAQCLFSVDVTYRRAHIAVAKLGNRAL